MLYKNMDSMTVHLMKHYYEVPIWRGGRGDC